MKRGIIQVTEIIIKIIISRIFFFDKETKKSPCFLLQTLN